MKNKFTTKLKIESAFDEELKKAKEKWLQIIEEKAEEMANQEDFTPFVTPIKSIEACRRSYIRSAIEEMSFDGIKAAPLRAFYTIIAYAPSVIEKERAYSLFEELKQAPDRLSNWFSDPLRDEETTLQEVMGLSDETMQAIYAIALQLHTEEKIDAFGDVSLFLNSIAPFEPNYAVCAAIYFEAKEELKTASEYYEWARLLAPDAPHAYLYGAYCASAQGNQAEATRLLRQLDTIKGDDSQLQQMQKAAKEFTPRGKL